MNWKERKLGLHPVPYKFDPRGPSYDFKTAEKLKKEFPLTAPRPKFDPKNPVYEVSTDSHEAWVYHPEVKKYLRHGSSLDPRTGMLLKGLNYSTMDKTIAAERARGNEIVEGKRGRYFSRPIKNK